MAPRSEPNLDRSCECERDEGNTQSWGESERDRDGVGDKGRDYLGCEMCLGSEFVAESLVLAII